MVSRVVLSLTAAAGIFLVCRIALSIAHEPPPSFTLLAHYDSYRSFLNHPQTDPAVKRRLRDRVDGIILNPVYLKTLVLSGDAALTPAADGYIITWRHDRYRPAQFGRLDKLGPRRYRLRGGKNEILHYRFYPVISGESKPIYRLERRYTPRRTDGRLYRHRERFIIDYGKRSRHRPGVFAGRVHELRVIHQVLRPAEHARQYYRAAVERRVPYLVLPRYAYWRLEGSITAAERFYRTVLAELPTVKKGRLPPVPYKGARHLIVLAALVVLAGWVYGLLSAVTNRGRGITAAVVLGVTASYYWLTLLLDGLPLFPLSSAVAVAGPVGACWYYLRAKERRDALTAVMLHAIALLIFTVLADPAGSVGGRTYPGVQLDFLLPLALTAVLLLYECRDELTAVPSALDLAIAVIIMMTIMLSLLRMNEAVGAFGGAEVQLRRFLELGGFFRPRLKEVMLLGVALMAGRLPGLRQRRVWLTLCFSVFSVSQMNTLHHLHTPLYLSLLRIGVTVLPAAAIFSIMHGLWQRKSY